jgi:hypothetical protein
MNLFSISQNSHYSIQFFMYTGCLKKTAMEIQQAVVHHKRG